MTQTPAGWYPVDGQTERYWDGSEWTATSRPIAGAPLVQGSAAKAAFPVRPIPIAPPNSATEGRQTVTPPWFKRWWVIGLAALLIGLVLGAASNSSANVKDSADYKQLSAKLSSSKSQLAAIEGSLPAREDAVKAKEDALKSRRDTLAKAEAGLKKAQADVLKREKAVGIVEKAIAANTISGDGVWEVGSDIRAGTYKTRGGSRCYYAILGSSDTTNIKDNNNITGPAVVTLSNGEYFQLGGCGKWTLQK